MKKYRNEWKYCCKEADLMKIQTQLATLLERDINGGQTGRYRVHSLYFDDYKNSCVWENDADIAKRFKYRIRYYGNDLETLKLERKEKYNGRCYKSSCRLPLDVYQKIIDGDLDEVLWNTDNQLLQRFCVDVMTRLFSPKAIIDYERTAYIDKNTNIRITLDRSISVSDQREFFLEKEYLRLPLQQNSVLEVKFDAILPSYIRHVITEHSLIQTAFSKYYLGRLQLQQMR